jgi:hypothetical protein
MMLLGTTNQFPAFVTDAAIYECRTYYVDFRIEPRAVAAESHHNLALLALA